MKDKVILITGATDGIGRQAAFELAETGATIIVHGRDRRRGEKTLDEIRSATGNENMHLVLADFASLRQVRAMASAVQDLSPRLDVLINNAGVYMKTRQLTEDGYEMTFGVNHLAPFLLTNLLLDLMKRSQPARIINVASVAHMRADMDFGNLQAEQSFSAYGAYALSKLANVLFTYELARRLEGTGVSAACLHPGVIATKLLRTGFSMTGAPLTEGSATIVSLATAPDSKGITGRYFDNKREVASSRASHNQEFQTHLWEVSEQLTGLS